jgi:hypothetical protein
MANEAYRNLRDILMNLLIQLAAEFFRKGGSNTELFERAQADVRRRSQGAKARDDKAAEPSERSCIIQPRDPRRPS